MARKGVRCIRSTGSDGGFNLPVGHLAPLQDPWGFSFIFPSLSGGYYVWQLVVSGWGRSSEHGRE